MRDSSSNSSKKTSTQKFSQGGEKKVMKKSLPVLLSAALAVSAFASFASAAELTAQEKFDALKAKGIFAGLANGEAGLDQNMTRAQFARVAGLLKGLNVDAQPSVQTYSDVPAAHWAYQEVEAATAAKLFEGKGDGTFGPQDNISVQQLAVVLAKALGLTPVEGATVEGADAWAAGYIKAVQNAGFVLPTNYTANATRGLLVEASYTAVDILNPSTIAVAKTSQTGAKKITVEFNRALTTAEETALKVEVKNGLVPYSFTTAVAADKKSAVLEFSFLPAADYSVKVNDFDAVTVKVVDETVSKLEIATGSVQKVANQKIDVVATNQFGEKVENASLTTTVVGKGSTIALSGGAYDLSALAKDDVVIVTATHPATGITATKTFKITDASQVTQLSLGPVVPLKDKTRITSKDEGLVLPYSFKDAAGNAYKLPAGEGEYEEGSNTVKIGDYQFIISNIKIVNPDSFSVDDDGVLTFDAVAATPAQSEAGTVVITVLNAAAGATANTSVKVEEAQKVKTFQLSAPSSIVAKEEGVKFAFVAADNYGAPIDSKEFAKSDTNSQVTFTTNRGEAVVVSKGYNYKGELTLTFTDGVGAAVTGTTTVYAWIGGAIASQVTVDLKAKAVPNKVSVVKDLASVYGIAGSDVVELSSVKVIDNYGREMSDLGDADLVVQLKSGATTGIVSSAELLNNKIVGVAAGSTKLEIGLDLDGGTTISSGTSIDVSVTVVADDKVASFAVEDPGLFFANADNDEETNAKTLTLVGKTAEGKKIAIDQGRYFTAVTSSDTTLFNTDYETVWSIAKGEATITFWKDASKLAEVKVTSSDAKKAAKSIKFKEAEYTYAEEATIDVASLLEIKDQYGADFGPTVYFSSSDATKVAYADGAWSAVAVGTATITAVTSNGLVATTTIIVNDPT
ncbi:S-layer homology domain-containing protein [Cohnella faecalis]